MACGIGDCWNTQHLSRSEESFLKEKREARAKELEQEIASETDDAKRAHAERVWEAIRDYS